MSDQESPALEATQPIHLPKFGQLSALLLEGMEVNGYCTPDGDCTPTQD